MTDRQSKLVDRIGAFTTMPNSVIKLWPQIGTDGIALFLYLRYRTNSETEVAFPGYTDIRTSTGLTRNRIALAIRSLEAVKVLTRRKRFSQSTIYTTHLPAISPDVGLLAEDAPLVQTSDCISPDVGLPLVRAVDSNKIDLTRAHRTRKGADAPPSAQPSTTREIQDAYLDLLGYPISDWGAGESKAAKVIAESWTVDQFRAAYQSMKAQPFWSNKRIYLRKLVGEMGELSKSNGHGAATPAQPAGQHPNGAINLHGADMRGRTSSIPADMQTDIERVVARKEAEGRAMMARAGEIAAVGGDPAALFGNGKGTPKGATIPRAAITGTKETR